MNDRGQRAYDVVKMPVPGWEYARLRMIRYPLRGITGACEDCSGSSDRLTASVLLLSQAAMPKTRRESTWPLVVLGYYLGSCRAKTGRGGGSVHRCRMPERRLRMPVRSRPSGGMIGRLNRTSESDISAETESPGAQTSRPRMARQGGWV